MTKKEIILELPSSTRRDLTGQVKKDGESCFAFGASADFWKGIWKDENGRDFSVRSTIFFFRSPSLDFSSQVAVKVIRSIPAEKKEQYERLKSVILEFPSQV